jgi:hypothetical protein
VKRFLIVVVVLVTILGGAYLYWMTTPLYAFQEAAFAVKDRNRTVFEKRVDVDTFIDSLLDDLLVHPAETTPDLNSVQRQIGTGAILLAKSSIEEEARKSIDRMFWHGGGRDLSSLGPDAAIADTASGRSSSGNLGDVLRTATHALTGELGKMKNVVYSRMELWARQHRQTLPGRLLGCPPSERGLELKQTLSDYGLKPENFKGISSCSTTDDGATAKSIVGLNFYSPRIAKEIVVQVEVLKTAGSDCWRISRIANAPEVLYDVGERLDRDMHALMQASLAGISSTSLKNEVQGVTDRIKQSDAGKNFLQQLRNRLGN